MTYQAHATLATAAAPTHVSPPAPHHACHAPSSALRMNTCQARTRPAIAPIIHHECHCTRTRLRLASFTQRPHAPQLTRMPSPRSTAPHLARCLVPSYQVHTAPTIAAAPTPATHPSLHRACHAVPPEPARITPASAPAHTPATPHALRHPCHAALPTLRLPRRTPDPLSLLLTRLPRPRNCTTPATPIAIYYDLPGPHCWRTRLPTDLHRSQHCTTPATLSTPHHELSRMPPTSYRHRSHACHARNTVPRLPRCPRCARPYQAENALATASPTPTIAKRTALHPSAFNDTGPRAPKT